MTEKDIQTDIMNMLWTHPRVAHCWVTTTGTMKSSRGKFYKIGYPGISDIIGQMKGSGKLLAIEVKTDIGKLSDEQAEFLDIVTKAGGVAGVARSVPEAIEILEGV